MDKKIIPQFVSHVTETLQKNGFEAYLVGGCVRDMFILDSSPSSGHAPKDWDITTNARPDQIVEVFSTLKTLYNNNFGTVTIINTENQADDRNDNNRDKTDEIEKVEVTTYRSEGKYSDNRRPDSVSYETDINKDLERRDFTVNAIAWDPIKDSVIDQYGGIKDIKDKIIRSVLYAEERFDEDALRMMRAIRFAVSLNFSIDTETFRAIEKKSFLIKNVSSERIRDEFLKIIASDAPALGITLLEKSGILKFIIPEIYDSINCEQKGAHIFDVYTHLLHALQHAADKNFSLIIRLAALLHDIGKPLTRRYDAKKNKYTFFGHEVVGAKMAEKILNRLRVPRETVDLVVKLVRNHMFFSDTEQISLSAVRRIVQKVGKDHIWDLMKVRECDRVGMKKVEAPYRLRKYFSMIEEVLHDPISVSQLVIDGNYLMTKFHMKPGPRIGWILHALLEEVLDNPHINTEENLCLRVTALMEKDDTELRILGEKGKEKKNERSGAEISNLRRKHRVS